MKLKEVYVDGYKNLIDCRLELGDFNLLVGPNNSGKTNLLEMFGFIATLIGLADESDREILFRGGTPRRHGSWLSNLSKYKNKPLSLGLVFEKKIDNELWQVNYTALLQTPGVGVEEVGFEEEVLIAKSLSKTGPWTKYIERTPEELKILTKSGRKRHRIKKTSSSITTFGSLYPDLEKLPHVFKEFWLGLCLIAQLQVVSAAPEIIRNNLDSEWIFSNVLLVIDEIYKDEKLYKMFQNTLCQIMDLEEVYFEANDVLAPNNGKKGKVLKRDRTLALKKKGSDFNDIKEYSDGTLVGTAILAAVFSPLRRSPILCIEEIENYLHPKAQERLLKFIQDHSERWPVLVTTHSPYLINGVNPSDVNVAVVDETGATHFEKLTNRKALNERLKSSYISFGDLLVNNFQDVLGAK